MCVGTLFWNGWGHCCVMGGVLSCNGLDFCLKQTPNGKGTLLCIGWDIDV